MSTKVIVRPTSSADVREYHIVGPQISDLPFAEYYLPLHGTAEGFPSLGNTGAKVAKALMAPSHAEEIERISFRPNSLRVRRAPTANWEQVETKRVMPALETALGSKFEITQYGSDKVAGRQQARV